MEFSAARVVGILVKRFGTSSDGDAPTRNEKKIASSFLQILNDAELGNLDVEEKEELEMIKDDVECDPEWNDEQTEELEEIQKNIPGRVSMDQMQKAWNYYIEPVCKSRSLSSMKRRYRTFIRNDYDLEKVKKFGKTGVLKENRIAALNQLDKYVSEEVDSKMKKGIALHDDNIRAIALRINKEIKLLCNFKASAGWIQTFKKKNRISSRRVTKFVARKNYESHDKICTAASDFVKDIKGKMQTIPLSIIANADQSGFNKEMHSARMHAPTGARTVICAVQSLSGTTHSYTVKPTIFADGRLADKLFIVLQEPGGKFPQKGHFQPDNLVVRAHSSHIMTKSLLLDWVENCLFAPGAQQEIFLIVDSWSAFRDHAAMESAVPNGHKLTVTNIPPGATSLIQPLDVFFFRTFKQMVRRFTSFVQVHDIDFLVHQRDNILKMISVIYRQFCSPRFQQCLQYPWFAAGYTDNHPGSFETPIQACFPNGMLEDCEVQGCDKITFIHCVHCNKTFCFSHFVIDYHTC